MSAQAVLEEIQREGLVLIAEALDQRPFLPAVVTLQQTFVQPTGGTYVILSTNYPIKNYSFDIEIDGVRSDPWVYGVSYANTVHGIKILVPPGGICSALVTVRSVGVEWPRLSVCTDAFRESLYAPEDIDD